MQRALAPIAVVRCAQCLKYGRVAPNRREPRSRMRPPKTPHTVRMQKIRTRRVGDALRLYETRELCAYVQRFAMKKSKRGPSSRWLCRRTAAQPTRDIEEVLANCQRYGNGAAASLEVLRRRRGPPVNSPAANHPQPTL
ncbi:unnamed protein product [Danaus chrysippus]|uniref:(African queen) hypothetical protein n=1 Tax=Danaus chrysippus TaxID=151541 RepID=A0A8J2W3T2_9NEOP|nr:unnamed protein product [Danaus chrysippus]